MTRFSYQDAKAKIQGICKAFEDGAYDTREAFMQMLEMNPHIAVLGYNAFGKIFLWNTAASHLYGYRESDAINQDIIELVMPPEMRPLAHDMISNGRRTGRMPDAAARDLLQCGGKYVTVFSGHLVFNWDSSSSPEFYCIGLGILTEADDPATATAP